MGGAAKKYAGSGMTHEQAQKTMAMVMDKQSNESCNGICAIGYVFAMVLVGISIWIYLGDKPEKFMQEIEIVEFNARAKRLDAAKQQVCGDNAFWVDIDDKTIQCFNKHGKKTKKASL